MDSHSLGRGDPVRDKREASVSGNEGKGEGAESGLI